MLRLASLIVVTVIVVLINFTLTASEDNTVNLLVVRKQRRVFVYRQGVIIASYSTAVGKLGWETPIGRWQVMEMLVNPGWTNFITGKVVAPGKNNPMGSRWIGFWTDGKDSIGFHGTQNIQSLGKAASYGCIRMRESDVQDLYDRVKIGTTVEVVENI